ncbi:effector protein Tle3 domain-containing protein, partial [Pseudomonas sp. 910_21]|uniref:effector protein Tle3 domain-containing protein n=1 Tax=Pseudomonas sp. 910_21 TaxID=2604460 RepID=UPI0040646FF8
AIGAGESVDDVTFYAYLCRVADWRLDWESTDGGGYEVKSSEQDLPDDAVEKLYFLEEVENRELIDSTVAYRMNGVLPLSVEDKMPLLVATQSLVGRKTGVPLRFGGTV